MKIIELFENQADAITTDVNNILTAAKARGLTQVSTLELVYQLLSAGYSVSVESIMGVLQDIPMVQSASSNTIQLKSPETTSVSGDDEAAKQNKELVSQMAQDAAEDDIGM